MLSFDPDSDQTNLTCLGRLPRIARFIALSGAVATIAVVLAGPGNAADEIEPGRLETSFDVAQESPTTVEPSRLESSFDVAQETPTTVDPSRIEDTFEEAAEPPSISDAEPQATFEPMIELGEEAAPPAGAQSITFTLASLVVEGSTIYEPGDFTPL